MIIPSVSYKPHIKKGSALAQVVLLVYTLLPLIHKNMWSGDVLPLAGAATSSGLKKPLCCLLHEL